jgi:hypothetical protein
MTAPHLPVYRLVDGKLVRVPGDVRDQRRRYSSTTDVQTGEQYLREFTDKEEREADAAAAKWEAERPQREEEAKRREEEAQRFRESLVYEERIVAFLDVMGWAAAIAESARSPDLTKKLGIAMQALNGYVGLGEWQRKQNLPGGWPGDPVMTQFSDSLLISFKADRHARSAMEMALTSVVSILFLHGFIVRGAIAYGQMVHRPTMAYGPAMVSAYLLEKETAVDPRIILSPDIAGAWGHGQPIHDRHGNLLGHHRPWRKDDDGMYFFDFLSNPVGLFTLDGEKPPDIFGAEMARWRELIVRRTTENAGNSAVNRKYAWLARYFNRVCDDYPEAKVERIVLP